jgi:pantetheine-phosphate adenylyltransferase
MKTVMYPGTFDPPTLGHLNVIQRAASKFDKIIVAIGENSSKATSFFSLEERIQFFKAITRNISNIEIVAFKGLLVDFAKSQKIDIIIRAIRTILDFESETLQAQVNRQLGGVETFYGSSGILN